MFPPAPRGSSLCFLFPAEDGIVLTWNVEEENLSLNIYGFFNVKANTDVWGDIC